MEKERKWLIWSLEHKAWWAYNRVGYTPDREYAGCYTFEEACKICLDANQYHAEREEPPYETMVMEY